jgi:uncharacterized protein YndB with AHSA1/START domain
MTIASIKKSIFVKLTPARAFDLFVNRMSDWWPRGRTPAGRPHDVILIEPRTRGRWFERDSSGAQKQWGTVLDWSPPERLLLAWQLRWQPDGRFDYDPTVVSEVELSFIADGEHGTLVTLEHRGLEKLAPEEAPAVDRVNAGWSARLEDFRKLAESPNTPGCEDRHRTASSDRSD